MVLLFFRRLSKTFSLADEGCHQSAGTFKNLSWSKSDSPKRMSPRKKRSVATITEHTSYTYIDNMCVCIWIWPRKKWCVYTGRHTVTIDSVRTAAQPLLKSSPRSERRRGWVSRVRGGNQPFHHFYIRIEGTSGIYTPHVDVFLSTHSRRAAVHTQTLSHVYRAGRNISKSTDQTHVKVYFDNYSDFLINVSKPRRW